MRGELLIVTSMVVAGAASAQQRWLAPGERLAATDTVVEFALPRPASGATTIALARDATVWFTQSNGNRIGRMNSDGSGLVEFDVPKSTPMPMAGDVCCSSMMRPDEKKG